MILRAARAAALLLAALPAAGCSSLGGLVGAATGTAAAVGSGNPAVGAAVGVGTRAVADYGIATLARRWHRTEQDALAATVGGMAVGEVRPWEVRHDLPIGNERGEVRLLRAISTPLAECREALFSVADGDRSAGQSPSGAAPGPQGPAEAAPDGGGGTAPPPGRWFLTSACRQGDRWKWATAEPATERWGSLQ